MIQIKKLFKEYKLGKEKLPILKDISMEIEEGEFLCILGSSGCGKSTLLNIIGGIDRKIEGSLFFDSANTKTFKEKDWVHLRKKSVGFIFQNFNLISHLTVQENVQLAMRFSGMRNKECEKRAFELLEMVGMQEKSKWLPSQLSGGQKQRVAIARALANNPRIILADEPTGALDSKASAEIIDLLHKINSEKGVAVVLVTHNKALADNADRIVYMADGKIEKIVGEKRSREEKQIKEKQKENAGKMSFVSTVQVGVKNVFLKKKRTALTIFGTAVGIAGMTLMLGIGSGAEKKVEHELLSFVGDETIWVTNKNKIEPITLADVKKLENIEGVDVVLNNELFMSTFYYNGKSAEGQMDAFGPKEIATDYEVSLANIGQIPSADDSDEIVITSQIAESLVDDKKEIEGLIGKKIVVLTRLLLENKVTYEVKSEFTVTGISDTGIIAGASFIPYETSHKLAKASLKSEEVEQKGAEIRAAEGNFDDVVAAIRELGYSVTTNKEDFKSINMVIIAFKMFLVFIAAISMFVSSVMIKIVLQTNVIERTQEIGIMSAIGAGKKEIKRIFMIEAAILGTISGVFGIVTGQILGMVLNTTLKYSFKAMDFSLYLMNFKMVVMCLAISVLVAAYAGRKPAKKAAKIEPAEALRYE